MVKKRIYKHTGLPCRPGEHLRKPKAKIRRRLIKNHEVLSKLKEEDK